jgi:FAD/FMN-containing dehydrogenase
MVWQATQSMVWHKSKPDRYPDIIIRARSEQDVIAAVKFAAQNKLKVTTRSGGHNATGASLRDGGVLIDLSSLNDVQVDVATQIASIQPAARSLQLLTAAQEKGLSFPVPHCPSVGMSGFVLGGGIGWNYAHRGGVASFSVDAADVITADGNRVLARVDQNPDLLWAVRGVGPGFFGAVTRLHLKLYPAPKAILASSYIHPLDGLANVTSALDNLMEIKDGRVEVLALLLHSPDAPPEAPAEEAKICFVSAFAFADSADEARALLAPFAESPLAKNSAAKVENQEFSYEKLYDRFFSLDVSAGRMARYAVDNVITDEAGKTLHALADHFRRTPSPHNHVLAAYGMNLKSRDDACFSSIGDHYVGCFAIWDKEEDDALNFPWLDQTLPLMDPFAKGHYVNEVEARLHPERIRLCFSDANWKRLQELRRKYDPNGVFHTYLGHT